MRGLNIESNNDINMARRRVHRVRSMIYIKQMNEKCRGKSVEVTSRLTFISIGRFD